VFHFIMFSCYRRQPKLGTARARTVFEEERERVRRGLSEPRRSSLAAALQVLKQCSSRRLKNSSGEAFWQRR